MKQFESLNLEKFQKSQLSNQYSSSIKGGFMEPECTGGGFEQLTMVYTNEVKYFEWDSDSIDEEGYRTRHGYHEVFPN